MLNENTLFGEHNKIEISLARIREFEPMAVNMNPSGYYVCVSGGKDSSVIQELCIIAGVKCEFIHNHSSVDHPETVYFVRREQERMKALGYTFKIEIPRFADGRQKTMWNGIEKNGLPNRWDRWCCREIKEGMGKGRYKIIGIRWAESPKRKERSIHESLSYNNDNDMKRKLNEICMKQRTFALNPIIDWSDDDVWEFLHKRKVPVNPLYAQGYKRVGCIACPLAGKKSQQKDFERLPKYRDAYFRSAQRYVERRRKEGISEDVIYTPNEYFERWLHGEETYIRGSKDLPIEEWIFEERL
jgi:phosphoadenosine phosphosulfate reductase